MESKKVAVITLHEGFASGVRKLFGEENVVVFDSYRNLNYKELSEKYEKLIIETGCMSEQMASAFCTYLTLTEQIPYTVISNTSELDLDSMERNSEKVVLYNSDESKLNSMFRKKLTASFRWDVDVLLIGETGSGKSYYAEEIVSRSARRDKPFKVIHCGNLNNDLFESKLFGYVKGAFTGAYRNEQGLIASCEEGTILFDDFDCLNTISQASLLDLIERRTYRMVGSTEDKKFNVRFLYSVKNDIFFKVATGTFRQDLFSRINGLVVPVPALRFHKRDIPDLIDPILNKYEKTLSKDGRESLYLRQWNSNVRGLLKCVETACQLASGSELTAEDFSSFIDL